MTSRKEYRTGKTVRFAPEIRFLKERYHLKLSDILIRSAQLFAKNGYHNTSMRDLAGAMNTSLAGLYHYFKTKEELLFLISQYSFDSVVRSLDERLQSTTNPSEQLHILVQNHLQFFVANLDAMKVLAHESDSLTGDNFRIINEQKKAYVHRLELILLEIHRGPSRKKSVRMTEDIKLAALYLFGMMNWTYTWYNPARREKSTSIEKVAHRMVEIFLKGFINN